MIQYFEGQARPRTAATWVKMQGVDSLVEMARVSGTHRQTLENWYRNKPDLFDLVLVGIMVEKGMVGGGQVEQAGPVGMPRTLLDDIAECSGRIPDPSAYPCPMRHRCERHLAFLEKAESGEPHRRPCMMPPESAFIRNREAPVQTWSCRHWIEIECDAAMMKEEKR